MTRRVKTITVLVVEAVLLALMFGSYGYFLRESRDFIGASRPIPTISFLHNRPRSTTAPR
jgi:hypothetical protein